MADCYEARYAAALREFDAAGLRRGTAEPPHLRLARRLGLRPRPPHYATFGTNLLVHGLPFGVIWGLAMWLAVWSEAVPWPQAVVAAALAGTLFGLVVAFLYRGTAERAGLRRWDDLPSE